MIETETNELGEVYRWEYTPTTFTTWEDATSQWNSASSTQPWKSFGLAGGWVMYTDRELHFNDNTSYPIVNMESTDRLCISDAHLTNDKNNYALQQVEIKNEKLSLAEIRSIAKNGAPFQYESFRPLIPGEYTYEKAMVGIRIRKNTPTSVVGFEGAVLNVDVEDVVDKGTVEVTSTDINNPTVVKYNKTYYKKPEELMFSVSNYSEPCAVEVLTNTDKQFTIMLKSTVNSNRYVTGTVHWLSNGY